jgi:DNA polymerase-3 subunit alpha
VGHNVVKEIVDERKKNNAFKTMADFLTRLAPTPDKPMVLNKKSLESLIKAGAFDKLAARRDLLDDLENLLAFSRESQKTRSQGQKSLFETETQENNNNFLFSNHNGNRKLESEEIQWEKELLGMYISDHPLNSHKFLLKDEVTLIKDLDKSKINKKVKIAGVINKITKFITKSGSPMLFVALEDLTGKIEALVFASILDRNPIIWQEGKIILLNGRLSDKDEQFKILCDEAEELKTEN